MILNWLKRYENQAVQVAFILVLLLMILQCIRIFALQMQDYALTPDWPWLYRTGLYILEHGTLPVTDVFSWTHSDQSWVVYQWLFEVIAAAIYQGAGKDLTIALFTLIAIALYVFTPAIALRKRVPVLLTIMIGAVTLMPVSVNFGLRPMLATTAFLLVQYLLIQRWRAQQLHTQPLLIAIALVYLVWANMHLGVVLGFVSLGIFAAGDWLNRKQSRQLDISVDANCQSSAGRTRYYAALGLVGFLASLFNPYQAAIYTYIGKLSFESEMNGQIRELMPPDPTDPAFLFAAGLAIVFLLALYPENSRRGQDAAGILHVLIFGLATMIALRFVVWAGLFYALVAPTLFWSVMDRHSRAVGNVRAALLSPKYRQRVVIGSLFVAVFGMSTAMMAFTPARISHCPSMQGAIGYMQAHYSPEVRWFSSGVGGSCTIWYAPGWPVFGDTRFDMYPPAFVHQWFDTLKARGEWRAFLDAWDIRLVLIDRDRPIANKLAQIRDNSIVYRDASTYLIERR